MMRDWDRFASLFTEDGAWRMPHINEELVSREEIRAGVERSLASPTVGRVEGEYQGHRTGDHRRDGLLLRRGPTAARHTVDVFDARDLAPATCALLDVPLPAASS
jgi:hypothetical protein